MKMCIRDRNTDRPKFQELVRDIKRGLIAKVVVYKLDRISRSILDFANMMELFQQYNVEFVSSTEKFDTSTPMGRAMLNICIVFAQLERETIQKRVTDAYYSGSQRGDVYKRQEDNRLCAKEIIGNRANLTKWQDDFHAYMVEKYPALERGESASKTGRKHIPTRLFKQAVNGCV